MIWQLGVSYNFKGWTITAKQDEDQRPFWGTTDPHPIGYAIEQRFATAEDANAYVTKREVDKVLFIMKCP